MASFTLGRGIWVNPTPQNRPRNGANSSTPRGARGATGPAGSSGALSNSPRAYARATAAGSATVATRRPSSCRGVIASHGFIANKSRVNADALESCVKSQT